MIPTLKNFVFITLASMVVSGFTENYGWAFVTLGVYFIILEIRKGN